MIISGNSDAGVLVDEQPNGGLLNFFLYVYETYCLTSIDFFFFFFLFRSFGFSNECLGQHSGALQEANLGDGNGYGQSLLHICLSLTYLVLSTVNETSEIRWNYGDAQLGACKETIEGGNHFRYWSQNGPQGNRCGFRLFCR